MIDSLRTLVFMFQNNSPSVLYPPEGRPSTILGFDAWNGSLNPLLLTIS